MFEQDAFRCVRLFPWDMLQQWNCWDKKFENIMAFVIYNLYREGWGEVRRVQVLLSTC